MTDKTPHPHNETEPCPGGCEGIRTVDKRLDEGDARMTRIETKLDQNCVDTSEVLDILRLGKSFFRLAGYASNIIKWATGIGASVLIFWYAVKDWPKH